MKLIGMYGMTHQNERHIIFHLTCDRTNAPHRIQVNMAVLRIGTFKI
jgi:hypothetical protein